MIKLLLHKGDKQDVTKFYTDIILEVIGQPYEVIHKAAQVQKDDIVVTTSAIDSFKVLVNEKTCKVINWYQGIIPEEVHLLGPDFLKSKLPKALKPISNIAFTTRLLEKTLNLIEKAALKSCSLNIFVSQSMLEHYQSKYGYNKDNYFVMPCFNTKIVRESFFSEGKYDSLSFAYAGGMHKWQCFDKIAKLYGAIEKINPSASLKVLTPDIKEAEEILRSVGATNYTIKHIDNNQIAQQLATVKYGFLIRKKHVVNYVSTPTKMSTYMANGVIPIFSDSIGDFVKAFESVRHKLVINDYLNDDGIVKSILEFNKTKIENQEVFHEYSKLFDDYYSREKYLERLRKRWDNCFTR